MKVLNLKKIAFYSMIAAAFVACKDDSEDPVDDGSGGGGNGGTPTVTCRLMSSEEVSDSSQQNLNYVYNSSLQLIKVEDIDPSTGDIYSIDSLVYDGSGMISEVHTVNTNSNDNSVVNYNWDGDNLVSATETRNGETTSYTFTYDGSGKLSTYTATNNGQSEYWEVVSWNGNNIDTVRFDFSGNQTMFVNMVATFDDKKNVARHAVPYPDDMIEWVNENNIKLVTTAEEVDFGGGPMPAGTIVLDREYTYTSEDEVATQIDNPSAFDPQEPVRTTTYTYACD